MNESARYTFGTSPAAAERLRSIGDFFNPIADMHIRRFVKTRAEVAIDLGCGPGFTTAMLAGATRCRDTYGLDRSGEFLAGARQEFGQYTFLEHDVTQVPFPVTPDVMYCRFVRSHLKHPVEIINRWLTQLQPRGFLFVDELNDIDSVLVFLNFLNAEEMNGPRTMEEWHGAIKLMHTLLQIPDDLEKFGVYHAFLDANLVPQTP